MKEKQQSQFSQLQRRKRKTLKKVQIYLSLYRYISLEYIVQRVIIAHVGWVIILTILSTRKLNFISTCSSICLSVTILSTKGLTTMHRKVQGNNTVDCRFESGFDSILLFAHFIKFSKIIDNDQMIVDSHHSCACKRSCACLVSPCLDSKIDKNTLKHSLSYGRY